MPLYISISEADKQVKDLVHNMAYCISDERTSTIYTALVVGDVFNITHKLCPQLELGCQSVYEQDLSYDTVCG